ncbi:hypothetical protein GCM10011495_22070 [Hymenobacter frigidus]|uniref:Secreted protein n=1 Tax=Hymenobacter frigidus TaxID=1524095 RepID=A0ABQ2A4X3_9BACT|nr:hypothetical protein GCM10011495_22070 [Hymenobacter frigidus]
MRRRLATTGPVAACAARTRGNRSCCRQKAPPLESAGAVQDWASSWQTGNSNSTQHDKRRSINNNRNEMDWRYNGLQVFLFCWV